MLPTSSDPMAPGRVPRHAAGTPDGAEALDARGRHRRPESLADTLPPAEPPAPLSSPPAPAPSSSTWADLVPSRPADAPAPAPSTGQSAAPRSAQPVSTPPSAWADLVPTTPADPIPRSGPADSLRRSGPTDPSPRSGWADLVPTSAQPAPAADPAPAEPPAWSAYLAPADPGWAGSWASELGSTGSWQSGDILPEPSSRENAPAGHTATADSRDAWAFESTGEWLLSARRFRRPLAVGEQDDTHPADAAIAAARSAAARLQHDRAADELTPAERSARRRQRAGDQDRRTGRHGSDAHHGRPHDRDDHLTDRDGPGSDTTERTGGRPGRERADQDERPGGGAHRAPEAKRAPAWSRITGSLPILGRTTAPADDAPVPRRSRAARRRRAAGTASSPESASDPFAGPTVTAPTDDSDVTGSHAGAEPRGPGAATPAGTDREAVTAVPIRRRGAARASTESGATPASAARGAGTPAATGRRAAASTANGRQASGPGGRRAAARSGKHARPADPLAITVRPVPAVLDALQEGRRAAGAVREWALWTADRAPATGSHRAPGTLPIESWLLVGRSRQQALLAALVAAGLALVLIPVQRATDDVDPVTASGQSAVVAEQGRKAATKPPREEPQSGRRGATEKPAETPRGQKPKPDTPAPDPAPTGQPPAAAESPAAPPVALPPGDGPARSLRFTGTQAVALTFDDGPDPVQTPRILAMLEEHGVTATFCLVGDQVRRHPDVVRQIVAAGHTLCNHSWDHSFTLGKQHPDAIRADLARTNEAIRAAVPDAKIPFFRAPGGNFTDRLVEVAYAGGMASLYWEVDPRDWERADEADSPAHVKKIVDDVRASVRPGSIVLSHDFNQPDTITAYAELLPWLRDNFELGVPTVPPPVTPDVSASAPPPAAP